jgi:AcrR family transcriptional regulator
VSQPSSFTVNDIAKEAGVTTSLLYFYFQSKDDVIVETLRTIASDLDTLAADANSPTDMASVVSVSLAKRPAFARIVAWFVLEGRSITDEMGDHPFMRRLIMTLAESESEDPLTQSGAVVALLLSNALLVDGINSALGRERDDERLTDALNGLIAAALIPTDQADTTSISPTRAN